MEFYATKEFQPFKNKNVFKDISKHLKLFTYLKKKPYSEKILTSSSELKMFLKERHLENIFILLEAC